MPCFRSTMQVREKEMRSHRGEVQCQRCTDNVVAVVDIVHPRMRNAPRQRRAERLDRALAKIVFVNAKRFARNISYV